MPNGTYGGVRGRKTKVGRKLLRFPPTRLEAIVSGVSVISDFPINYRLAVFLQGAATEL